jgi:hypothetical protein
MRRMIHSQSQQLRAYYRWRPGPRSAGHQRDNVAADVAVSGRHHTAPGRALFAAGSPPLTWHQSGIPF